MRCPECGMHVPDNLSLCPTCGVMVEETQPMRAQRARRRKLEMEMSIAAPEVQRPPLWPRILPILLWAMGFLVLMTLSVGAAAYFGRYQGERDRLEERLSRAEEHYRAGLERLDAGQFDLAIAEFEYVLRLNPNHPTAAQGIAEARARQAILSITPTPTSEVYQIVLDDLYQRAVAHYNSQRWEDAAAVLTQIRVLDPTYSAEEIEEMLFTSFYNAGMALLNEDRLEEGIFYLDQAVAMRPVDEAALTQRSLAVQYLTALDYWGADWEECIARFEALYAAAPAYKDVAARLYNAHVTYAEAWYEQGEMCPAEIEFMRALRLKNDPEIEQKRASAGQICLVATPTPISPITGSLAITLTTPPPGFTVGRLAYPNYNNETGVYDIYVLSTDGRLVRMAGGADQPCWVWGNGALGYRDRLSPGIAWLWPGGTPQQLRAGAGYAWPTFSPDGGRMAYAVQDAAGTWQIYIAPTNGAADPVFHAQGKGPVWSPTGLLAWTGCDATGACGIFADNPDDDQPATRLTASLNDIGLNWAPNGQLLVYMSDVSGNWDIYLLSITGGVVLLTSDPATDGLPAWAPNGSGIAFVSNRDGAWGVYLMGPNGEDPHKILTLGPNMPDWTMQRLSWSP